MEYTENYSLNLPSGSDKATPDAFNENFRYIDDALNLREPEQTYDPTSSKPQSGKAVAEALTQVKIDVDDEMSDESENPVQNKTIKEYVDDVKEDVMDLSNMFDKSINLYNEKTNSTFILDNVECSITDFIYLKRGDYVITNDSSLGRIFESISVYDLNRNQIEAWYFDEPEFFTLVGNVAKFTIKNACFVRFECRSGIVNHPEIMLVKGVELPTKYVPYKNKIKLEHLPNDTTENSRVIIDYTFTQKDIDNGNADLFVVNADTNGKPFNLKSCYINCEAVVNSMGSIYFNEGYNELVSGMVSFQGLIAEAQRKSEINETCLWTVDSINFRGDVANSFLLLSDKVINELTLIMDDSFSVGDRILIRGVDND
jgi:hypothetical protein